MIFARRAIQRRLDGLRSVLGQSSVAALAGRLNRPGADRLAAMWEVAVLHSLLQYGTLINEAPLPSGRRPDVSFENYALSFTADVTSVSDDGVHDQNPYRELSNLIEAVKKRLGLNIGGVDLRVGSREKTNAKGTKTFLSLPNRGELQEFVKKRIEPELRRQMSEGQEVLHISIDDEAVSININIDPRRGPYSTGGFAAYDTPTIKDQNPLYNALKSKAGQLRGAQGLVGIIVGDGGSRALRERTGGYWDEVGVKEIVDEFLRQYSSIDFVLLMSVKEKGSGLPHPRFTQKILTARLVTNKSSQVPVELEYLLRDMVGKMPVPIDMPINAAIRARENGFWWGHHGGHRMSGSKITVGAREVVEVLAGRRSVQAMNEAHGWLAAGETSDSGAMLSPFERHLSLGCLPVSVTVVKTDENEADDWIEIEFGPPDPAIAPFK